MASIRVESLTFLVSLLWLLCMLAAAANLTQQTLRSWIEPLWLAGGFALALIVAQWIPAQAEWVGLAVALIAAARLVWPGSDRAGLIAAGVCAGLAAGIYAANGLQIWLAGGICLALLVVAAVLARSPQFVSSRLRENVLLVVAWLAPIIAAAPGVVSGWRSAQALNQAAEASLAQGIPVWAFATALLALIGGMVRGFWVRK